MSSAVTTVTGVRLLQRRRCRATCGCVVHSMMLLLLVHMRVSSNVRLPTCAAATGGVLCHALQPSRRPVFDQHGRYPVSQLDLLQISHRPAYYALSLSVRQENELNAC